MEKTVSEILSELKVDSASTGGLSEVQRDVLRSQCIAMMFAQTQESVAISSMVIFGAYGNSIMQEAFRVLTDTICTNMESGMLTDIISSLGKLRQEVDAPPAPAPAKRAAKGPTKPKLVVDNTPTKRKPGRPRKTPVTPPAE